ncbi:MAG: HipA domain-containing protein, partial [Deltaproteobacteria bacterium]|nr:HipA domain-containing protein [Deltaproteobacteria bacterium]
ERFDRVSIGRKEGRKGVLSLEALVNEFVEEARSWSDAAVKLFKQKIISDEMVTQICKLELFGRFIGNTDMHFGNLSFFSEGEKILGIAPVYDMLPMLYAPQGHQIIERNFDPKILSHAELLIAKEMFPLAVGFWGKISEHTQISKSFRMIAKENLQKVENLRSVMNQIE